MKGTHKAIQWLEALREQAEKVAAQQAHVSLELPVEDVRALTHELNVYHIELEMQNRELRETQSSLELSRKKYYELFDLAPVGYATLSQDGRILEANLTLCDMLQTDRRQIQDKPLVLHVASKAHTTFYEHLHSALQSRKRRWETMPLRTAFGHPITVRMEIVPVFEKEGVFRHFLVTITDISPLVQALQEVERLNEELQISQQWLRIRHHIASIFLSSAEEETLRQMLRLITQELSTSVALVALGSREKYWVTSVERDALGQELTPAPSVSLLCGQLSRVCWDYVDERRTPRLVNKTFALGGSGSVENLLVFALRYQDHFLGFIATGNRSKPFADEDQQTVHVFADSLAPLLHARLEKQKQEMERRRLESEKRRIDKHLQEVRKLEAIGRLAAGVAHDFNNALQVILGRADLLLQMLGTRHPGIYHVEEIQKSGTRAAELVRQLLTFASKQTFAPKVLHLNQAVEGLLKFLRRLIGENIELVWNPDPNLWAVYMDPSQLDQILVNLCANAKDAIDGVGRIVVETNNFTRAPDSTSPFLEPDQQDWVVLSVTDNGCGMDSQTLEKIFDPFFTTKEFGKGVGLGLATVYGIVKQNRGHIHVESMPEKGTCFRIYLPRCQGNAQAPHDDVFGEIPRGRGETILLVEDDAAILSMTEAALERLGYTVLSAVHPHKAMEWVQRDDQPIDLLLTDVIMPDLNGQALAKQILKVRPDVKVVFMSGYASENLVHRNTRYPMVHILKKPFSHGELARTVRSVLDGTTKPPETLGQSDKSEK